MEVSDSSARSVLADELPELLGTEQEVWSALVGLTIVHSTLGTGKSRKC
jgi:hypothetical protein